jgi:hypothetical protein
LLAQYRCDEIANAVSKVFTASLNPFENVIESGKVSEYFEQLQSIRDNQIGKLKTMSLFFFA